LLRELQLPVAGQTVVLRGVLLSAPRDAAASGQRMDLTGQVVQCLSGHFDARFMPVLGRQPGGLSATPKVR
jgi:hypothetical protein